MAEALEPNTVAAGDVGFALDRFEYRDGRLEVDGRWFGVRGRRFIRPTLTLGSGVRLLAELEHKPWAADDAERWQAAFRVQDADGLELAQAELAVAPDIAVRLPAPGARGSRDLRIPAEGPRGAKHTRPTRPKARKRAEHTEAAERDAAITERNAALARRDAAVAKVERAEAARDAAVAERAAAASERDAALADRDAAVAERETALRERDAARGERDGALAALESARAQHATSVAERDAAMRAHEAAAAARDRALADRDVAVAQLNSQPAAPGVTERYTAPPVRAPADPPPAWQRDVDWPRRALAILVLVLALIALGIIVRLV